MRAVRYPGAVVAAVALAVATVATVTAAYAERTSVVAAAVRVDASVAVGPGGSAPVELHLSAATDGSALLAIDQRAAAGAAGGFAYRGRPAVRVLDIDPSLAAAIVVVAFVGRDGMRHVVRAELRAAGPEERWTDGPYAPPDGPAAALRVCDSRAVVAVAKITLDGDPLAPSSVRSADIVSRSCSTVALIR